MLGRIAVLNADLDYGIALTATVGLLGRDCGQEVPFDLVMLLFSSTMRTPVSDEDGPLYCYPVLLRSIPPACIARE